MKTHLGPKERAGLSVALVVAQEVINYSTYGGRSNVHQHDDLQPVLHTFGDDTFSFEGGVIVLPKLEPHMRPSQTRYPEWVVVSVEVRYYRTNPDGSREQGKTAEVWDRERLERLRMARPWQWPIVASVQYLRDREDTRRYGALLRDLRPEVSCAKPAAGERPPEDPTFARELGD